MSTSIKYITTTKKLIEWKCEKTKEKIKYVPVLPWCRVGAVAAVPDGSGVRYVDRSSVARE